MIKHNLVPRVLRIWERGCIKHGDTFRYSETPKSVTYFSGCPSIGRKISSRLRYITFQCIRVLDILGDPGVVGQSGREKGRDESFQVRAKEPLGTDSHRTISKNSSGYWLLIGHKKMLCIIVPNRRTVSPEFFSWVRTRRLLPGSFTKIVRAMGTFIFYFPDQKRRNYRWIEKKFAISRSNSICAKNILFLTHHNVSQIIAS